MNDNRPSAELIQFPPHKVVRKNPKQVAAMEAKQNMDMQMDQFMTATQEFNDVLLQGFIHFGIDTRSMDFKKDQVVIQSIIAAVLAKQTGTNIQIPFFSELLQNIKFEETMLEGHKALVIAEQSKSLLTPTLEKGVPKKKAPPKKSTPKNKTVAKLKKK